MLCPGSNIIRVRPKSEKQRHYAAAENPYYTCYIQGFTLRKHAYSYIMKILPPKNENFQKKKSDIFHISALNIDCGYSLEPPR